MRAAAMTAIAITTAAITPARAEAEEADNGVYGRFDGDLDLRLDVGAAFAAGGPALATGATALYLQTAGIYAHYTDALGGGGPDVARSISVGVLLTPLFLARYATDMEHGPARLDLFIDSIGLGVGAFWDAPRGGALRPDAGIEIALLLGFPLLPQATGPFLGLRGALRFRAEDIAGAGSGDILDRGAVLSLTLGWHHIVRAHFVDAGDRLPR
jgi:hypothetical protein